MTNRRPRNEFSKRTKIAAWDRSGGHCEECGAKLYPGKFTYDHTNPDVISRDNSLENCKVLCSACDKTKTAKDQGVIAKVRRIEEKHIGAAPKKPKSKYLKKVDGTVVYRDTRQPVRR